jgi:hypothetical protein
MNKLVLFGLGLLCLAGVGIGLSIAAFVTTRTPTADAMHLQIDSLGRDLDESRGAFNTLAQRFSVVEQRCVFRTRRPRSSTSRR